MAIIVNSVTFSGIEVNEVKVEVDINKGLPSFCIVGLPDASIKESKERVRTAIVNSGYNFPLGRITVNLAPADIKKIGALLDLPIAIGILLASRQIKERDIKEMLVVGELSLSGKTRRINGALAILLKAIEKEYKELLLPYDNIKECIKNKEVNIYPVTSLKDVISMFTYGDVLPFNDFLGFNKSEKKHKDFRDVCGNESAKRALEIAACGNHNIILYGPPGSGKTMLAERVPSILPNLTLDESIKVSKIYSIQGKLDKDGLLDERPFRAPHHTITSSAMVGGGKELKVGEVSLAHKGVLFLDELLEFDKNIIELLREPLQNKKITISRLNASATFPCDFMFIGAFNPCKCGYFLNDAVNGKACTCSEGERIRYLNRLSKAILDRIDMFIYVPCVDFNDLRCENNSESSSQIKKRVIDGRKTQESRYKCSDKLNSSLNHTQIIKYIKLEKEAEDILRDFWRRWGLSNRSVDRIVKVSRTIADLENSKCVLSKHVLEALNYRKFVNGEVI